MFRISEQWELILKQTQFILVFYFIALLQFCISQYRIIQMYDVTLKKNNIRSYAQTLTVLLAVP
mgnify:CR=1 FL=1